ncbi:MAG: alginate lyase family protein [Proteobacteria bacterium]|nr:alginate lyase family protein [Pseudomonadota bacterium]
MQTFADGVNREQASWYHHLVTDMMLITGLFARANGRDFGAPYWQRLERMVEFIASIMNVTGQVPAFGDADDAVLVRFYPTQDCNAYRSLLATCGLLFERRDFLAKSGPPDDKARWLLGDAPVACYAGRAYEPDTQPARRTFPDGGYYVLGDRLDSMDELRIVADAGPLGYLSLAAHGHADALSFTLSKSGHELLVDSGTYAYHTQREWREYFRGTAAHNTLRVDGVDQSVQTGSFLWGRRARVSEVDYQSDAAGDRLSAAHDGYARLPDAARVARRVNYERARGVVLVHDELRSRGPHLIEIFWHFSEHCVVTLGMHSAEASCQGTTLKLTWPRGLAARLVRGQENPPLGWRSKAYDVRIPIDTLVAYGEVTGDWDGTTTLEIG